MLPIGITSRGLDVICLGLIQQAGKISHEAFPGITPHGMVTIGILPVFGNFEISDIAASFGY